MSFFKSVCFVSVACAMTLGGLFILNLVKYNIRCSHIKQDSIVMAVTELDQTGRPEAYSVIGIFFEHLSFLFWNPSYIAEAEKYYEKAFQEDDPFALARLSVYFNINNTPGKRLVPRSAPAKGFDETSRKGIVDFISDPENQKNSLVKYVLAYAYHFKLSDVIDVVATSSDSSKSIVDEEKFETFYPGNPDERLMKQLAEDGFAPAFVFMNKDDEVVLRNLANNGNDLAQMFLVLTFLNRSEIFSLNDLLQKEFSIAEHRSELEICLRNLSDSMVAKTIYGLLVLRTSSGMRDVAIELLREAARYGYPAALKILTQLGMNSYR